MLPVGVRAADRPQQHAISLKRGVRQVGASKENSLAGPTTHVCCRYLSLFHRDTVLQAFFVRDGTFLLGCTNSLLLCYIVFSVDKKQSYLNQA
jgi:hypothetical protein